MVHVVHTMGEIVQFRVLSAKSGIQGHLLGCLVGRYGIIFELTKLSLMLYFNFVAWGCLYR